MNLTIEPATIEIVQNLGCFYAYELSRYCKWRTPEDGIFQCIDLSDYWSKPDHYPFLIKVDNELAGFVLVRNVDGIWDMGQFFIVAKFQRHGIGQAAAEHIFNQFPGQWQIWQMPENAAAIDFWEKVIAKYTKGNFTQTKEILAKPAPHTINIMRFDTSAKTPATRLVYKENASPSEEATLIHGIIEEARKKDMSDMKGFSFFIKDADNTILAGIKGTTYYKCLYIDSLWVSTQFRKQGLGTKLMQEAEQLGKDRQCTFSCLTTMDWEAYPFYQRLGYASEYTREGFEKGAKMHVLRKEL